MTSGCAVSTHWVSCSWRARIPLTFQVAIFMAPRIVPSAVQPVHGDGRAERPSTRVTAPEFTASFLQEVGSVSNDHQETTMRKLLLLLLLVLVTPSLFAQDWRDRRGDRNDRYRDNAFELTPFAGYRWSGTLYSNTGLFNQDVNLESSANFGVSLGIPIGSNLKVELLGDPSNSNLTTGN